MGKGKHVDRWSIKAKTMVWVRPIRSERKPLTTRPMVLKIANMATGTNPHSHRACSLAMMAT